MGYVLAAKWFIFTAIILNKLSHLNFWKREWRIVCGVLCVREPKGITGWRCSVCVCVYWCVSVCVLVCLCVCACVHTCVAMWVCVMWMIQGYRISDIHHVMRLHDLSTTKKQDKIETETTGLIITAVTFNVGILKGSHWGQYRQTASDKHVRTHPP